MKMSEFIDLMKTAAEPYGEVVVDEVVRASARYVGMYVKKDGVPTPIANLDMLYERYLETDDIDECTEYVTTLFTMKFDSPINIAALADWEVAKGLLFLRLFGHVSDGICRPVADLYQVPYLQMKPDGSAVAQVTPQLLETWGVSIDEVFDQAEKNQESIRPAVICNLSEMVGVDGGNPLYLITTTNRAYGASAILYDGVAEQLRDALGDKFYLIPSSVHEMMAFAKLGDADIPFFTNLISTVNREELDSQEILSNSLYIYDFETHSIKRAV